MILPDVNVLIYAFRADTPHHSTAFDFVEGCRMVDVRFGISPLALSALIRITTQPRFLNGPSLVEDAFAFCEDLLGMPHCVAVEPGKDHWTIFRRLCRDGDVRGADVTDAWYAALAIERDCEWITYDRDFARFRGLRWRLLS